MGGTGFSIETFELPRKLRDLHPSSFKTSSGRRGWCVRIPGDHRLATPAVVGDLVLLGGGFGSHHFYALDANTGTLRWRMHTSDDGPTAAVAYEGLVAFNTESCTLIVCEAATGKELWSKWLGDPLMSQPAIARVNGHAAVVMAYPGRGRQHRIAAFDLLNGDEYWSAPVRADVISAPIVVAGTIYAALMDGTIVEFDARTGKLKRDDTEARATSAPWVAGDELFYSHREEQPRQPGKTARATTDEEVEVFEVMAGRKAMGKYFSRDALYKRKADYLRSQVKSEKAKSREAYLKSADAAVGFPMAPPAAKLAMVVKHLGYAAGTVGGAWGYQGSRPVVVDDVIYSAVGSSVRAERRSDRTVLWELQLEREDLDYRALTPVAVAGRFVFTVTTDGVVFAIDRHEGTVAWAVRLPTPWVEFQPAIEGGRIFIGTAEGMLFCLDTQDPTSTGWPMWGGGPGHNGHAPLSA